MEQNFFNVFSTLQTYFSFDFVRYALIVAVFISLASSLLGVTIYIQTQ